MNKRFSIYALVVVMMTAIVTSSCNSDEEDDFLSNDPLKNALMVNTFALQKNDSILVNLDSVFFSIDLDRGVIFNADSLPRGTKVDRLVIDMTMSAVTKAEITMPTDRGTDTVINFLRNATDSINFSRGYVKLHLESANKEHERDYTIYVNVHKVDPDLLVWNELASTTLPSGFADADAQHTVEFQGRVVCVTRKGSAYSIATSENPTLGFSAAEAADFPADCDLNTLTAGETVLYVCDTAGDLYSSADGGKSWSATGTKMSHIYGAISDMAVGVAASGSGEFTHVTYPETTSGAVAADCPVSATSPAVVFTTEWSEQPMMFVSGGVTAGGELSSDTWAYDGTQWAKISLQGFGKGLKSPVVVPYFAYKTATNWTVTKRSILMAFNGLDSNGDYNDKVYVSYDRGVHWSVGSGWMEIPVEYRAGAFSQGLVINSQMTSAASSAVTRWRGMETGFITPPWLERVASPISRASAPITEWDCPYIYVFGGETSTGQLHNCVWRGVINRLQFKPLQ